MDKYINPACVWADKNSAVIAHDVCGGYVWRGKEQIICECDCHDNV